MPSSGLAFICLHTGCATGPAHRVTLQGVAGIGIVNAVEVVHAFGEGQRSGRGEKGDDGVSNQQEQGGVSGSQPGTSGGCGFGLRAFREWLEAPDEGLIAAATGAAGGRGARGGRGKGKGKEADSGTAAAAAAAAAVAAVEGDPSAAAVEGAAGGQQQAGGGGDPGESGGCARAG